MRSYIRHPSDIPIKVSSTQKVAPLDAQNLNNISHGGLSFMSDIALDTGQLIQVTIDAVTPVFHAEGVVTYCSREGSRFVIGIKFIRKDDLFVARMVEQVCHIEHYKREIAAQEGRRLSGEQAAKEWIDKYAARFPQWSH